MRTLMLLCGPSGSGKSTYIKNINKSLVDKLIVLSSDTFRAVVGTGEEDQTVNSLVFDWMRKTCAYFLSTYKSVVIDATNLIPKYRKEFIQIGQRYNTTIKAVNFTTDIDECKKRNQQRGRKVPDHVIDKHFQMFVPASLNEGFTTIYDY